jgi:hypothetical protein
VPSMLAATTILSSRFTNASRPYGRVMRRDDWHSNSAIPRHDRTRGSWLAPRQQVLGHKCPGRGDNTRFGGIPAIVRADEGRRRRSQCPDRARARPAPSRPARPARLFRLCRWSGGLAGRLGPADPLVHPLAGDLPGGGVDAVPGVDRRDRNHQPGELRLVVVAGCLLPHVRARSAAAASGSAGMSGGSCATRMLTSSGWAATSARPVTAPPLLANISSGPVPSASMTACTSCAWTVGEWSTRPSLRVLRPRPRGS